MKFQASPVLQSLDNFKLKWLKTTINDQITETYNQFNGFTHKNS